MFHLNMNIRIHSEDVEKKIYSSYACHSYKSRGRRFPEPECPVRTCFQRDRDRIIHSKSFRRLKHKTQVFIIPEGDHYRTRLTHTLEVAQIARTIARALRLNEDLTEAIALGHDLGHTPFGHAGEVALNEVFSGGFKHNLQSIRVVTELEGEGGLNLTFEVLDGILNHTGPDKPVTLEGQIVKIADRVAYINHDIDDAIRGGILNEKSLPPQCTEILGLTHRDRINAMVVDLINNSLDKSVIAMSSIMQQITSELRSFLFEKVYIGSEAKREEKKAFHVIQHLYSYLVSNPHLLPEEYYVRCEKTSKERVVCDFIAGMTDRYAISQFEKLFIPRSFSVY